MRTLSIVAMSLLLAATLTSGVSATSPHQVDPGGLTPPLNPAFGPWICTRTGAGSVCRGAASDAWSVADTGLACGNRPVFTTGSFQADATRWHLPDGRATHTFFNNKSSEVWSLSPDGQGRVVNLRVQWQEHFDYPDPGIRATRVRTTTGSYWQVTAPGYGLVWHDVGYARFVPGSNDEIAVTHGPTDSDYGNLDLVLPAVCAILGG
jgi:hypothetical protein